MIEMFKKACRSLRGSRGRRCWQSLRELSRDTSGVSTPEYVLVASVIICAVVSIGSVIGNQSKKLHALTAQGMGANQVASASKTDSQQNISAEETQADSPTVAELAKSPTVLIVGGTNLAMILLFLVTLAVRKRRRIRPHEPMDDQELWNEHAIRLLRAFRSHTGRLADWDVLVETAMCREVTTLRPNARIGAVQRAIEESPHGLAVIAESNGQIVGMIDQERLADSSASVAGKIMDPEPTTVDHRMKLSTAAKTMINHGCTAMPVTADGKVCGVISYVEMTLTLQATLQMLREIEMQHKTALMRTVAPKS